MKVPFDPLFAVISVPKPVALRHVGLLLPDGLVANCAPQKGEHLVTLDQFVGGEDVTIEQLIAIQRHPEIRARIIDALRNPQPYHPLKNNCEMFVNRMLGLESVSPQLQAMSGLLVLVGCEPLPAKRESHWARGATCVFCGDRNPLVPAAYIGDLINGHWNRYAHTWKQ